MSEIANSGAQGVQVEGYGARFQEYRLSAGRVYE